MFVLIGVIGGIALTGCATFERMKAQAAYDKAEIARVEALIPLVPGLQQALDTAANPTYSGGGFGFAFFSSPRNLSFQSHCIGKSVGGVWKPSHGAQRRQMD
jgi:hypothetical protein